jgi:energy-coupling factor transporter ATP-binding protein EcfA2
LKALTLLVGENSSGKSTLLAALAALSDRTAFPGRLLLNREPHDLGTYRTVATYKGGKFGRAKSFSIGYGRDSERPEILATYKEVKGDIPATPRPIAFTPTKSDTKNFSKTC